MRFRFWQAASKPGLIEDHTLHASFCNLPGDVNGDGSVSATDLALLRQAYGSHVGGEKYNPRADINQDEYVTSSDLVMLRQNYGTSCP
jgi:hypothetical protein